MVVTAARVKCQSLALVSQPTTAPTQQSTMAVVKTKDEVDRFVEEAGPMTPSVRLGHRALATMEACKGWLKPLLLLEEDSCSTTGDGGVTPPGWLNELARSSFELSTFWLRPADLRSEPCSYGWCQKR